MNYSNITLGELLSSQNETIRRNATSILKQLQRKCDCNMNYGNKNLQGIHDIDCNSRKCEHKNIVYGEATLCNDCKKLVDFTESL